MINCAINVNTGEDAGLITQHEYSIIASDNESFYLSNPHDTSRKLKIKIEHSENLQTRQERVDNHKVAIFNNIQSRQHAFIEFVLKQYIQNGVTELDNERIGDLINLKYGSVIDAQEKLGPIAEIKNTFLKFQKYLYKAI